MAELKIADVIVPAVFNPYVVARTNQLSALYQSGIISHDAQLDSLASSGGKVVQMPFWNDLTGVSEILSDSSALTANAITTDQDQAVIHFRGKMWGANDLTKALSGADPMAVIGDLVAGFWARDMQTMVFSLLKGIFASTTVSAKVADTASGALSATNGLDISAGSGGNELISASTLIDAIQKMGDAKDRITAIAMHSAVESALAKKDLIQTVRDSQGQIQYKTYMDKRVIVDDGCPVSAGVYTTYLFGQGAIGLGNGTLDNQTETDRDKPKGVDYLINRKSFLLHPRGVKFNNTSVAGVSPTNAELETAGNWTRVYEGKSIRIVKFVHKI